MQLSDILAGFTKTKEQLTTFIEDQNVENEATRAVLNKGEVDVKRASNALKQITKAVGK